jgi:hypothetical protein
VMHTVPVRDALVDDGDAHHVVRSLEIRGRQVRGPRTVDRGARAGRSSASWVQSGGRLTVSQALAATRSRYRRRSPRRVVAAVPGWAPPGRGTGGGHSRPQGRRPRHGSQRPERSRRLTEGSALASPAPREGRSTARGGPSRDRQRRIEGSVCAARSQGDARGGRRESADDSGYGPVLRQAGASCAGPGSDQYSCGRT